MRTVSSPAQTELVKQVTQPGFFVELTFASQVVRWCSFGDTTWNSLIWIGQNFQVGGLSSDGMQATISVWDSDAAYRTLAVTDGGLRNRSVKIWTAQFPALADDDPNLIFQGVGDGVAVQPFVKHHSQTTGRTGYRFDSLVHMVNPMRMLFAHQARLPLDDAQRSTKFM